ncbi:GYD domain-containing protein [Mesorhizobium sp. M4B.F.Ca.ET.169.01.1.1]|uniref:GYD domain-containing protein n=1 Tax=unclassified Mesorhizobium TaxID=325217 RepID=UPI000FCB065F|nr:MULTISPECIES: GYD domain-containing protein [unclassified Mesorhizobium]RVD46074.1 GYD domain-containing protein [Mesorhizobium sp. M4B.F.Ca.ET.019.03.1.1]TGT41895.1 GYD domain-containing protein [Mesorhizobium sp. M4B.F.Ca.ET.169.01.1.1]
MPYFISLMRLTQRGLDEIANSPERARVSRERVEALGGRSVALYATMGAYDFVQIFEMPSEAAMMQYLLVARQDGHVDPVVLRSFDAQEWSSIVEASIKS